MSTRRSITGTEGEHIALTVRSSLQVEIGGEEYHLDESNVGRLVQVCYRLAAENGYSTLHWTDDPPQDPPDNPPDDPPQRWIMFPMRLG